MGTRARGHERRVRAIRRLVQRANLLRLPLAVLLQPSAARDEDRLLRLEPLRLLRELVVLVDGGDQVRLVPHPPPLELLRRLLLGRDFARRVLDRRTRLVSPVGTARRCVERVDAPTTAAYEEFAIDHRRR